MGSIDGNIMRAGKEGHRLYILLEWYGRVELVEWDCRTDAQMPIFAVEPQAVKHQDDGGLVVKVSIGELVASSDGSLTWRGKDLEPVDSSAFVARWGGSTRIQGMGRITFHNN